jgi:hypothetical protein
MSQNVFGGAEPRRAKNGTADFPNTQPLSPVFVRKSNAAVRTTELGERLIVLCVLS